MTGSVFLQLATLCLAGSPVLVKAGNQVVATCTAASGGQAATVQTSSMTSFGAVTIQCPESTQISHQGIAAGQSGTKGQVYPSSTAEAPVELQTLLVGATFSRVEQRDIFTVVQLPKDPIGIFFRCNNRDNQTAACWIEVKVPAQPPLGPQVCAVGGSQVALAVTAAGQNAQFACATDTNLQPTAAANVYDTDCTTEVPLTNALPGATLTRATAPGNMNSLTVPNLPTTAKGICLVCSQAGEADASNKCSIKINVSAAAGEGFGTLRFTARTASALGVLLVGAVLTQNI